MPLRFISPKNKLLAASLRRTLLIASTLVPLAQTYADTIYADSTDGICDSENADTNQACNSTTHSFADLDWLNKDQLNPAQQHELAPGCTGIYVDPFADQSIDDADMAELPLIVEADSTEVIGGVHATLEGDVEVSQGPRSIAADKMVYSRADDSALMQGDVVIRQQGLLIRGESARVDTTKEEAEFIDARIVLHNQHIRGSASSIAQEGRGKAVLRNGHITSCAPDSNAWSLEGAELGINELTGQGYGKHVKFRIADVPIFYLPYATFPVGDQRQSGFLAPSFSTSDKGGLDISLPYYLNLAPNYDATITPRIISDRGPMLEAEFRHLSHSIEQKVSGSFLPDDGGSQGHDGSSNTHVGTNRWLFQYKQNGGLGSGWYTEVDYNLTSDEDYFRDLGTSSFEVANTTYLDQKLVAGTQLDNWDLNLRVQDYQTLLLNLDAPYRKLPQIEANGNYYLGRMNLNLDNQLTSFDHEQGLSISGKPIITGQRYAADYTLGQRFSNAAGYIKPEVGYKYRQYKLSPGEGDSIEQEHVSLGAPQASVDASLVFENPQGRYLQTLEPRLYYLYRSYEDHSALYNASNSGGGVNFDTSTRTFSYGQLYRDSRFSGYDRLDDANRLTAGITNRWMSHKDGHEFFALSLGQINYFEDRRVGLESDIDAQQNSSEIALEFSANARAGSGVFGNLIYDDAAEQMSRFSAGYNYASQDKLSLVSLSYSFVRKDPEISSSKQLDQVDLAFVAPIVQQWFMMGRSNYDFENQQELETFGGIEYNNCCYRVRFLARRWLDSNVANEEGGSGQYDRGVYLEIEFKGLGSTGTRIRNMLEDALPGYERRERLMSEH
ncbi:LPS-assembly protein LptD [Agaribacterium sp. ZY112]|uniref:LPS-assembly protein LptD n=1 Tax=Agaribacterium sp. ZY112 TaxID=3233574 RepID=UPI003523F6B6